MYQCLLFSAYGQFKRALRYVSVSGARKQHEIGTATIVLDADDNPPQDFPRDSIVIIVRNRKILSGSVWRVRGRKVDRKRAKRTLTITLKDQTDIIARRIVGYRAGNANSNKTGTASDLMRAFFSEQFVTSVDSTRNVAGVRIDSNDTGGNTFTINASFDNLLTVLRRIHTAGFKAGSWIGFGLELDPAGAALGDFSLVFRVYNNQVGVRRNGNGNAGGLLLSESAGNITNVVIDEDWTSESSFVYAAGSGQEEQRLIAQATNASLVAVSPFGRIEHMRDVSNVKDANHLQLEADSSLLEEAGAAAFSADIVFGNGIEWDETLAFGDIVPVLINDVLTSARVDSFGFACDRDNADVITARVMGYLS